MKTKKRPYRIDPEVAHERAKKANAVHNSLDNHVRHVVESAPLLTDEQIAKLRALLPPENDSETSGGDG